MSSSNPPSGLDPSSYSWAQVGHSVSPWRRKALSFETTWLARPKELHEIFVSGLLAFETPLPSCTLYSAVRQAWQALLFEVPELQARAVVAEDGNAYMQYRTPQDRHEVEEWAHRTAVFDYGDQSLDFKGLRENILIRKGDSSDPAFLLLYLEKESDGNKPLDHVHIILNTDHEITDGIGTRILFGKYLSLLSSCISEPQLGLVMYDWAESSKNLSPPWISIMNQDQAISGSEFEETVAWNKEILLERMNANPGLPLLLYPGPLKQETTFLTLSQKQTTSLLNAIKTTISPQSNITHLGHSAMVLALLRSSPSPSKGSFYSSCWLNGRRYLRATPSYVVPGKAYVPICMSFAPIIFHDMDLKLRDDTTDEELRNVLVRVCRVATEQYGRLSARKSILGEFAVVAEEMGRKMLKPSHPPVRPKTSAPILLSDGLTDRYICHSYPSSPSPTSTPVQQTVGKFTVDDVYFAANSDGEVVIRMSSFRGRMRISAEWRSDLFDGDMVRAFVDDVRRIMLVLVGDGKGLGGGGL
ncbi:uncharacterized protein BP5553_04684 [Venustampulla echinocandica]|uniref:Uncharacterized protein n=1 Tax=Venustampulla echinocandica TaxID=2656787 RepID=A0A370TP07_9HELO|nr:uncharacterized protein BP5553_04684 [Venustampulla echinocandica]RDL37251.1 hypothetical protein BP5553_04684 [Venustampulla echinocandica]